PAFLKWLYEQDCNRPPQIENNLATFSRTQDRASLPIRHLSRLKFYSEVNTSYYGLIGLKYLQYRLRRKL
ncbi:hypothetical protein L9F63_020788, partial [Diploptera punctata]